MPGLAKTRILLLLAVTQFTLLGCEEHDHDEEHGHEHGGIAVTVWTDQTEVFFEHPPMVAGVNGGAWAIHVTRLSDFSPVTEGALQVTLQSGSGQTYTFTSDAPARAGIFLPEPVVGEAGMYDVTIVVQSPQLSDRIDAGEVVVYGNTGQLPHEEEGAPGGEISFLKEQQWPIDFGVARVDSMSVRQTINVNGSIVPASGQVANVTANVGGLLIVDRNLKAPAVGDVVRRGETLAVISPVGGDNSYADLKARVERLRRESERLGRLYEAEAIPERRVIEARHDLEVAEAELESMGGHAEQGYDYTVRAPISGVVYERSMVPGSRVVAGDALFSIVNPEVVWVRLNLSPRDAVHAEGIQEISFAVEGSRKTYRSSGIVSVGSVLDSETRTLPVTASVVNDDRRLKIGMFVEGLALVNGLVEGVAVPVDAIQQEDGRAVAYVQTGGESFERRELALGATDGKLTLVGSGVDVGEYVVTQGAYQVYLASLSSDEVGDHGHAH